jgi:hypothetical protein
MKFLALVVILAIAACVILVIGLTRNAHRARLQAKQDRKHLAAARKALSTIAAYSNDEYSQNIASLGLVDSTTNLSQLTKE